MLVNLPNSSPSPFQFPDHNSGIRDTTLNDLPRPDDYIDFDHDCNYTVLAPVSLTSSQLGVYSTTHILENRSETNLLD